MLDVLLISPNTETFPDPVFPIGTAYVASSLKKNGISCKVLDLSYENEDSLIEVIGSFHPKIIGISMRNVDNVTYPGSVSYVEIYRELIKLVRKNSDAYIVLGGSGFTLLGAPLLNYLDADFGIIGEGEESFPRLVTDLLLKGNKPNLRLLTPGVPSESFSSITPLREDYLLDFYINAGGMVNLQTKRGCPFGCIYCSYPAIEGKRVRSRPISHIISEIKTLRERGYKEIFFVDSVINHPIDYFRKFLYSLKKAKLDISWTAYASPFGLDQDLLLLAKDTGCIGLEFGTDSMCEDILKSLKKPFSFFDVEQVSHLCHKVELPFCHSLLLGGPGETERSIKETFSRLKELAPTASVIMTGIRIYPNTHLYKLALAEGIIKISDPLITPVFYISREVRDSILHIVEDIPKEPVWIAPTKVSPLGRAMMNRLRKKGLKGPLWIHLGKVYLKKVKEDA